MIEPVLIAYEVAAQTLLADLADKITRRKPGYLEPKTGVCELDVSFLPSQSTGHLIQGATAEVLATVRVAGRGPDGTAVLDRVRFISELAVERLLTDPSTAQLFAKVTAQTIDRDHSIDQGSVVAIEVNEITVELRYVAGTGGALGIVESASATFPSGRALVTGGDAVVYPAGLDSVLLAPATVTALYAGIAGGGVERLELRDAGGDVVASEVLAATAGTHDFLGVGDGDYNLTIVRISNAQDLATTADVRVRAAP